MTTFLDEVRAARRLPSPSTAKLIRESAGVSLSRLAREVGVSPSTVLRWERGTFRPRGPQGAAYAALLEQLREIA